MDKRFLQKDPISFGLMRWVVCLILLATFILPVFVSASGAPYPVSIYEPYRIKRNLEYVYLNSANDYYAYLLGDKLNPLNFYAAYRYFQDKPLNTKQVSDIEKIYKSNGNYAGGNDPSYWESEKYLEEWKKERNIVMGDNFAYGQENNSDDYNNYRSNIVLGSEICPFGTFENATKILREKKKTLSGEELKIWIQNQDKVFSNCFETWSSWSDRTWRSSPVQITCDDNKLQGLKVATEEEKKEGKGFFAWLKSLFVRDKPEVAQSTPLPSQSTYYPQFVSFGSAELRRDEEMQNALYYYYKAKKEYLCSNIAGDLFKKISEDLGNPYHANAMLGYLRSKIRDGDPMNLEKLNEYLSGKDLIEIRDALLIEKEKILSSSYNESEFIKSQKGLENPSVNFIHDAAIFRQQYLILAKEGKEALLDSVKLANHSELVRFLYYWNFDKPDSQWLVRVESEFTSSTMPNLWLALLLREQNLVPDKYMNMGLSVSPASKIYYPVSYYAHRNLVASDKNKALASTKAKLSGSMPNLVFNYFSDLVMKNSESLDNAVVYMDRKPTYIKFMETLDYGYVNSERKPLESLLNQEGWQDEKTGATYYYKFIDKGIETPIDDNLLTFVNFGLPIERLYSNPDLRQEFKGKIFTRAFLLGRKDIYGPLLNDLSSSDSLLANAARVSNEKTQRFLIAYAILKNLNNGKEDKYGITIHNENFNYYSNTGDWDGVCNYCSEDYVYESDKEKTEKQLFTENKKTGLFNKYLTAKEIEANIQEKDKLFYGSLVEMFAEPVLAYRELSPGDGRIPEALSLIISKMRRWHYRDSDGDWTYKVFQTLQYKYPKSSWAKDTPVYW